MLLKIHYCGWGLIDLLRYEKTKVTPQHGAYMPFSSLLHNGHPRTEHVVTFASISDEKMRCLPGKMGKHLKFVSFLFP